MDQRICGKLKIVRRSKDDKWVICSRGQRGPPGKCPTIEDPYFKTVINDSCKYLRSTGGGLIVSENASDTLPPNVADGGVFMVDICNLKGAVAEGQPHSVGLLNVGISSHTEGIKSLASGLGSHAEGFSTLASGIQSHTEGSETKATQSYTHAEGSLTTASGILGAHAEGANTLASGSSSHAEGSGTKATGNISHAEGFVTLASGGGAHAEGDNTIASGDVSHAEGIASHATGEYSHAEGENTTASDEAGHAEGRKSMALGKVSHAEGNLTRASGIYSHAEGFESVASGDTSHAEGFNTKATNPNAHAEGNITIASGFYSHAEGFSTIASGDASHAEGLNTSAIGVTSHAEGEETTAGGDYSHAGGKRVIIPTSSEADGIFAIGNDYTTFIKDSSHTSDYSYSFQMGYDSVKAAILNDGTFYGSSFNPSLPADYAEYFEIHSSWLSDFKLKANRYAYFVSLKKGKIVLSPDNKSVLGITSATAGVTLDSGFLEWNQKYQLDKYGRKIMINSCLRPLREFIRQNNIPITKDVKKILQMPDVAEVFSEFSAICPPDFLEKFKSLKPKKISILNPAFDPTKEYIPRQDREEWIEVGLMGKIRVREQTPGCCEGIDYCDCKNGVAVPGTRYPIIKRVAEVVITILK